MTDQPEQCPAADSQAERTDARQPAYDAVFAYIRDLGQYLPPDPVHRNAIIWRAVQAALDATPIGRCISSHCVEGDHVLIVDDSPAHNSGPTAEAALARVRKLIADDPSGIFSDDEIRTALGEQPAPAPAATQAGDVTDPSWSVQCRPPGCGAQPGQRCRRWDGSEANVSCGNRWREYDRQQAAGTLHQPKETP